MSGCNLCVFNSAGNHHILYQPILKAEALLLKKESNGYRVVPLTQCDEKVADGKSYLSWVTLYVFFDPHNYLFGVNLPHFSKQPGKNRYDLRNITGIEIQLYAQYIHYCSRSET